MSILRTIAMFIYLFGYMILHYGILRRAERAAAAGDTATVEQIVNQHIPRWSRGILKVTGVSLSVEGLENIIVKTPGLDAAGAAKIKSTLLSEAEFTNDQITIVEVN